MIHGRQGRAGQAVSTYGDDFETCPALKNVRHQLELQINLKVAFFCRKAFKNTLSGFWLSVVMDFKGSFCVVYAKISSMLVSHNKNNY